MKDIWIPLSAAVAQNSNVETIANNIANINTPGFKKDQQIFKEHLTNLNSNKDQNLPELPRKEWSPEDFYRTQGAELSFVKSDGSYTIFEQGQLVPTGNSFDLAVQGPGLFEVLGPNGIRYTRKGNFSLSKDGNLVTEQGFLVLSKLDPATLKNDDQANADQMNSDQNKKEINIPKPEDRVINLQNGRITFDKNGGVFANDQKVGEISIVEFNDLNFLKKEGNSLFINGDNKNIKSIPATSEVHQGFIESSNVNALSEISSLIKANRQFESIQKAIKAYDEIANKSVNEISRF